MHQDQAWPQASDFAKGGGFHELTLRLRSALVWGGFSTILLVVAWSTHTPVDPFYGLGLSAVIGFLPGVLAWSVSPSALLLGGKPQARIEWEGRVPVTRQPENLVNSRQERRDIWAFLAVIVLTVGTGLWANFSLLLLFSPLIVFRLCSRLWTEVDLVGGRIYYHRTFMGMQITRQGASLEQAVGLISGVRLNRPGEDPVFAVCAVMPAEEPLPLDTMSRSREESHALGRRLSLQLNLLHDQLDYEPDLTHLRGNTNFRGRPRWKAIQFGKNPDSGGSKLPPLAEAP